MISRDVEAAGAGMRLTIEKAVSGGYGLARSGGVVLVRGALPGEVVDAAIVSRKKDYATARTVAVVEPSAHRVPPPCPVYGECGGCTLQHADYPCQLAMKASSLADTLRRIAKTGAGEPPVRPSRPFRYRHRGQFKANASGVGFHAEGTHRLVPVEECPLMVDGINGLLPACREAAAAGGVAGIVVASDGERTVALLGTVAHDGRVAGVLMDGGAAGVGFRDGARGSLDLVFRLGEFRYGVSGGTFFQANWTLNRELVGRVRTLIGKEQRGRVLDLYAGAGNFTLPLSSVASEVVAVEEDGDAFRDLKRNVEENGIGNVRAVRSRIERFRPSGRYDAVVVDPPRTGLSERAVRLLVALRAPRVLYVSCNAATLARDLSRLSELYGIADLEAWDFFPQTHHVETLVVLARRQ